MFALFIGGIATAVYEEFYGGRITRKKAYRPGMLALIVGIAAAFVFQLIFLVNQIYPFIVFTFVGALVLCIERKDLIKHSLVGGVTFTLLYALAFILFNLIFPDFVSHSYHLENLIGLTLFGVPVEEFFYAFSFGLLWAPFYEYYHGVREKDK